MKQSFVSVVLPTHNRIETLRHSLESVLAQTYSPIEIVLVDDYSNLEIKRKIEELAQEDARIRIVRNEENIGFVRSLNKGIREARGKYIARLDDDDSWCDPKKLEKQVAFMEQHREYVLVGGGLIRVDEDGREIVRQLFPETDEAIRATMLITDPFVHPAVLFRKEDVQKAGGYDEKFHYSQDWELWMRLGKLGKYYNFQEYFVRYLQSSQNRSNKNMRHHLWLAIVARKRYKDRFPNFWKGYMLGWLSCLFSFIPIRYRVSPFFTKTKRLFFK